MFEADTHGSAIFPQATVRSNNLNELLHHLHDAEELAIFQWHFNPLHFAVTAEPVERDASESGTHFEAGEVRVYEEGADLGGVPLRIEEGGLAARAMIAAEEGTALAPATAAAG